MPLPRMPLATLQGQNTASFGVSRESATARREGLACEGDIPREKLEDPLPSGTIEASHFVGAVACRHCREHHWPNTQQRVRIIKETLSDMPKSVQHARRGMASAWTGLLRALLAVPFLACVPSQSAARDIDRFLDRLILDAAGFQTCGSAAAGTSAIREAVSAVSGCAADRVLAGVLVESVRVAEDHGQGLFGENFHIDSRLRPTPGGTGIDGDLDAVFPLRALALATPESQVERALFLQSGMTRWTDHHGFRRNDVRHGLVHRFAAPDGPVQGIFGAWAFVQQNLERGHERFVAGVDYSGRWGITSLNYFIPSTGWLPGRAGFEERALEGLELDFRFDATNTISLNAVASRWEDRDGQGEWSTRARLGFEWRPHPWLGFGGSWTGIGTVDEGAGVRAAVAIPLGGAGQHLRRWQGIGLASPGLEPDASSLWRAVGNVGRIEIAERSVPVAETSVSGELSIRFLQDSVDTGGTVRIEVALASPVSTETRLNVRLVPGSGENPAVPGEDYVDETVNVIIPSGKTSAVATFRLLDNPLLQTTRSLSVAVSTVT